MSMEDFAGTGKLARLILRRDWKLLLAWAILLPLILLFVAMSFLDLYSTQAAIQQFVDETNSNLSEVALVGKVLSASLGGLIVWKGSVSMFIISGLAGLLAAIKYTRTEEEKGRLELVSSMAVGKYAQLTAAFIVACAVNLLIAAMGTIILLGFGLPAAGSLAFALSIAAAGWVFIGVGAVSAQIGGSTGSARGIAGGILALAFIVRVIADGAGVDWLSWFTPDGWMTLVHPYAGENWLALLLSAVVAVVLIAVAFILSSRRDLGTGLLPQRSGRAVASPTLRSPLALAWRLQRGMLIAFAVGFIVVGVLVGLITKAAADQVASSPQFMEILARMSGNASPADSFFSIFLAILGFVTTIYAVLAALKMQSEENEMHAEAILATPVSRLQWATGHLAIAIIGSAALLVVFGLVAGTIFGASMGNLGNELPRVFFASLAYLPAIWIIAGIAVALFGLLPRLTIVSWGALVICLLVELAGDLQIAGGSLQDLSPFAHVPKILAGDTSLLPLVALAILAALLVAAGLYGLQRRSIG